MMLMVVIVSACGGVRASAFLSWAAGPGPIWAIPHRTLAGASGMP